MNLGISTVLLLSLGLGTTITFASSHWLIAWMGLEINSLAILPIMAKQHHPRATEAAIKYFFAQATGAATLLFAALTHAWMEGNWNIMDSTHPLTTSVMALALALKLGLAPLHLWLPEVLQGVSLTTGLILSTWQKLAPFALLVQIKMTNPTLLIIMAVMSMLVGGWGGLNQTQLRKILAYSSIAHLGWMLLVMQYSPPLALMTLLMYMIMTLTTFLMFKALNTTTINALSTTWTKYPLLTSLAPLIMLSLAGLPPLSGFLPKWLILMEMSKHNLGLVATIAAFSALLSLYFYLRLAFAIALTVPPNNLPAMLSWRTSSPLPLFPLTLATPAALGLLPLAPLLMALLTP